MSLDNASNLCQLIRTNKKIKERIKAGGPDLFEMISNELDLSCTIAELKDALFKENMNFLSERQSTNSFVEFVTF
jgi:hypothetical protein